MLAGVIVVGGIIYAGYHLANDLSVVRDTRVYPFVLLGIALFIALGFEFVNGFHDTANAVATVIYTHSLPPNLAVVWSGSFNFLGVLVSSGAVAFGIVSLLPVELILQVGSGAGFAMVFALLIAAILWNLGTWYFGLPSSSSHTLIGSIMGVGLMNQLMAASGSGTSGVDWGQAAKIGESLLFSPLIGFSLAALLLLIAMALIPMPALYQGAEGQSAAAAADSRLAGPHLHRRELRAWLERRPEGHGAHHADPHRHGARPPTRSTAPCMRPRSTSSSRSRPRRKPRSAAMRTVRRPPIRMPAAIEIVRSRSITPQSMPALVALRGRDRRGKSSNFHSLDKVPAGDMVNIRNDMYLVSEGLRLLGKSKSIPVSNADKKTLARLQGTTRQRDQVHSDLGQGRGGRSPWDWAP